MSDGIALLSMSHPKGPWWKHLWLRLRNLVWRDLNPAALESVNVRIGPPSSGWTDARGVYGGMPPSPTKEQQAFAWVYMLDHPDYLYSWVTYPKSAPPDVELVPGQPDSTELYLMRYRKGWSQ